MHRTQDISAVVEGRVYRKRATVLYFSRNTTGRNYFSLSGHGVLDGMESMLKSITKPADKVHMIRYADDFIITGSSKEQLENTIKPAVTAFLFERGLTLSKEKTAITSITHGFDFLGFNVRNHKTGTQVSITAKDCQV